MEDTGSINPKDSRSTVNRHINLKLDATPAQTVLRPAFSITTFRRWAGGISRSWVYVEISEGRLSARKIGRRTIILPDDAEAWLKSRPSVQAKPRNREED